MKRLSLPDSPLLFPDQSGPNFELERGCHKRGFMQVAGVDEVGRGPLAGPVVTACVILDPDNIPGDLNDSKKLTIKRRDVLFGEILNCAEVSVASIPASIVDGTNILQATLLAMKNSIQAIETKPDMVLVDGRDCPPGLDCQAKAIIRGDARSLSISAASIVAKVIRDQQMVEMAEYYPDYGFENHKGYGTKQHLEAITRLGPCALHRMSFAPMRIMNVRN